MTSRHFPPLSRPTLPKPLVGSQSEIHLKIGGQFARFPGLSDPMPDTHSSMYTSNGSTFEPTFKACSKHCGVDRRSTRICAYLTNSVHKLRIGSSRSCIRPKIVLRKTRIITGWAQHPSEFAADRFKCDLRGAAADFAVRITVDAQIGIDDCT